MNITTTGKILFWDESDILDDLVDYCEQYGETDLDDSNNILTVLLEENWDQDWQETGIELVKELHEYVPSSKISLVYSVHDHDSERVKSFECQYKNEMIRYRDTDWVYEGYVDDDITYDEFEEEGHVEVAEECFDDYVRQKTKSDSYSDWECVDLD